MNKVYTISPYDQDLVSVGTHEWITSWLPDQHNDKDIAILKYDFQCLNLIYILQKMNNLDLHQPPSAST